jgi:hypothetical protein
MTIRTLAAISFATLLPCVTFAQTPETAARPTTEAADSSEESAGFVERIRDKYNRLRASGIKPTVGSIRSGSSLAFGFQVKEDRLFGTWIGGSFEAGWSVRGYQQYDMHFGRLRGRSNRAELGTFDADLPSTFNDNALLAFGTGAYVHIRQRVFPRTDFFGMGQDATKAGRSDFALTGPSIDLVGQWQPNAHVGVSGRAGTIDLDLQAPTNRGVPDIDTLYTDQSAPGLTQQHGYRTAGASVTLDFRDEPDLPSKGTFAGIGLWRAWTPTADGAPGWSRFVTDVRHFVSVPTPKQVLAFRLLMSTTLGGGAVPTPFYLQPTIGGSKSLRGFGSYRLRGDAVWGGTVEYRLQAHKWIQIAPFVDVGAVGDRWSTLTATRPTATPGIGLRATREGHVIGRLDFATGRDGSRAVITLSTPF